MSAAVKTVFRYRTAIVEPRALPARLPDPIHGLVKTNEGVGNAHAPCTSEYACMSKKGPPPAATSFNSTLTSRLVDT